VKALTKNASDVEQVKSAGKKQADVFRQEKADVKDILSLKAGRRFIWKYLNKCSIYQTSVSADPYMVYFNEGMRNIGLQLMDDINSCDPELYMQMLRECNQVGESEDE